MERRRQRASRVKAATARPDPSSGADVPLRPQDLRGAVQKPACTFEEPTRTILISTLRHNIFQAGCEWGVLPSVKVTPWVLVARFDCLLRYGGPMVSFFLGGYQAIAYKWSETLRQYLILETLRSLRESGQGSRPASPPTSRSWRSVARGPPCSAFRGTRSRAHRVTRTRPSSTSLRSARAGARRRRVIALSSGSLSSLGVTGLSPARRDSG